MGHKRDDIQMTPAAVAALARGELGNFVAAVTPGGIEAQEAQGQRDACAVQRLPRNGTEDRAAWEALGFKFGAPADNLFVNVTFPPGWKLLPTDHSMWNKLVDETGKERFSMFYKAAFYDRDAFIRPA